MFIWSGDIPQGDQLCMAVCVWYLVERDLSSVRYRRVECTSVTFSRYQNNTDMFIWSGVILQGDQLYVAVCVRYLVERDSSSVLYYRVECTSVTFSRYQNNTAMFIWSGVIPQGGQLCMAVCFWYLVERDLSNVRSLQNVIR